jgi:hypothetical protein
MAVAAALVLAAAAVLSPVTVAAVPALALVVAAGVRGRTGLERRLLIGLVVLAIAVRVAMIVALFLLPHDPFVQVTSFPFDGDGRFMKVRALWLRNVWLDVPINVTAFQATFGRYGWTSYFLVTGYVQYLLGAAPYAIHLFNVCCYVGAALLLHRTLRPAYGALTALLALALVLFMPTLIMWSAAALKESLYILLWSIIIWGLMKALRERRHATRLGGLACAIAAASAIASVRYGSFVILVSGLGLAAAGAFLTRRIYLALLLLTFSVVLGSRVIEREAVQARLMPALRNAAMIHMGNVTTMGHSYPVLDRRFYAGDPVATMTWPEVQRYVIRALASFVLVPLPQQVTSRSELLLLPQQVLWYALVGLAVVGVVAGCRRDLALTWLLAGLSCAAAGVIALNSGNVGTLVRIRDSVVPFILCLSALGVVSVASRLSGARSAA